MCIRDRIDTAAGLSDSVITFSQASNDVLLVVCNEPASITDAYAMIKLLSQEHGVDHFQILANRVAAAQEGHELFNKLVRVTDRFLDVTLNFCGFIPEDPQLRKAVQAQRTVVEAFPNSRSTEAFHRLAAQILGRWPMPRSASGYLQFFVERMIDPSYRFKAVSYTHLLSALVIGVLISLFQAATQINEMTLSFVPKLLVLVVVLLLAGPWMLELLVDFTRTLFKDIPHLIG